MTVFALHHDSLILRPPSLIRAANAGQSGWRRQRHLPKLLRLGYCPKPISALPLLLTEEAKQNEARKLRAPSYDIQKHVLFMIAILAEYRALSPQEISVPGRESPKRP